MDDFIFVSTFLAALGTALMAGNFFAFSAAVLTALGRLKPEAGIAAMRAITAALLSPLFLAVFFGTAILAAIAGLAAPFIWSEPGAGWLLAGSLLYLNGPFGVTLLRNVPLNNKLAAAKPEGSAAQLWKEEYLPAWTLWNHVRTAGALAAAACFTMALVRLSG
jgi:uncharacterized membrane protein